MNEPSRESLERDRVALLIIPLSLTIAGVCSFHPLVTVLTAAATAVASIIISKE